MPVPIRVLLVDDDDDAAARTVSLLREIDPDGFEVQWERSAEGARRRIADCQYDICLVDRLAPEQGIDVVREAARAGCGVPFIVLTGLEAREVDVEAMSAGASDYLVKGQMTPALLERSIRYALQTARSQAALRDSERRLREVADNVKQVLWVYDCARRQLTYVNPAFDVVSGRSRDGLAADPRAALDYVHPDDRRPLARALERLAAGEESEQEFRIVWPDGSERWIRGRGFPVAGDRGTLARLVGTAEDVTARRRAERARRLQAAAGRVSAHSLDLQQTLEGIARLLVPDLADGCVIDVVNETGEPTRRAWAFVDPDKRQAVREMRGRFPLRDRPWHPIWQVLATGQSFLVPNGDLAMVAPVADDPEELALGARARPTSCMLVPLTVGSRVLGVMRLCTDPGRARFDEQDLGLAEEIGRRAAVAVEHAQLYRQAQLATERERAQAARLRLLADLSKGFAEAAPEFAPLLQTIVRLTAERIGDVCAVRVLSADLSRLEAGAVHHRNPDRQRIMEELLATPLPLDSGLMARLFETGEPMVVADVDVERLLAMLPPGHHGYLDEHPPQALILAPLLAHGRILGTLGIARERPAAPYTEDDVLLFQQLADHAALIIENARLFDEAQRAVRTRDEIIAVVSHDVANPLQAISAGSALLLGRRQPDDSARTLLVIQRAAERVARIMRDLLDSTALHSGRLALALKEEDASRLVDEACEIFEQQARSAAIALVRERHEGLSVRADRGRVIQVLGNLIGNALKFTPAGGTVTVKLDLEGNEVCFSVSDTGPGIDERDVARMFERFYQKRRGYRGGLGLGLAISKAIIDAHGGRIWLESAPGGGSSFRFTLPLPSPDYARADGSVADDVERNKRADPIA